MRNEHWVWPKVGGAGTSGAGAVPLRSAQMMGQQQQQKEGITKVTLSFFHRGPCGMWLLYSKSPLRRRVSLGGQLPASVAKAFVIAPGSSLRYFCSSFFFLLLLFVVVAFC